MDTKEHILEKVRCLLSEYKKGNLGGEKMPEDENPHLEKSSKQNYMYFTLPMALNYQRNSYVLWECANRMYADKNAKSVFDSKEVCSMSKELLQNYLVQYKVALQPNKQPVIWAKICETIENRLDGDIRNLFIRNDFSVEKIKNFIKNNKKDFPYLGGNKICNYWLFVLEKYAEIEFVDREKITVAPDTHVIQASCKLGVITEQELLESNIQQILAKRWERLLEGTGICPIDVHTPLWLWSRGGFEADIF